MGGIAVSGATPGPWQSRDDMTTEGFVTIIANVDGEILDGPPSYTYDTVAICEDEYGDRLPNVAANVRLFAAAPELLAALEKARNTLAGCGMANIATDICDAAIAKATGK